MTTSEFIEMLQKEDPSGTAYIRMEGGIPYGVELKAGYWDGPFSYLDKDGNYTYSIKGSKVDLYCMDIWGFVERNFNRNITWEEMELKFKFELNGYCVKEHRDERSNSILRQAKEAFDEIKESDERSFNNSLSVMIENAKKGWKWYQNKDVDLNEKPNMHKFYTWEIFDENRVKEGSNIHCTLSVQESGMWERIDNNEIHGYYQWVFKE